MIASPSDKKMKRKGKLSKLSCSPNLEALTVFSINFKHLMVISKGCSLKIEIIYPTHNCFDFVSISGDDEENCWLLSKNCFMKLKEVFLSNSNSQSYTSIWEKTNFSFLFWRNGHLWSRVPLQKSYILFQLRLIPLLGSLQELSENVPHRYCAQASTSLVFSKSAVENITRTKPKITNYQEKPSLEREKPSSFFFLLQHSSSMAHK